MNVKKILFAGLAAGVAQMVLATLSFLATQETWMKYGSLRVWREMPMPSWLIQLSLGALAFGIIYAVFYEIFYDSLPGEKMLSFTKTNPHF